MFYQTQTVYAVRRPLKGPKMPFLSPVTLTFGLDLQTRPSEGPYTSSMWIWCKSVQRFPRYFTHKQKTHTDDAKKTEPSAVHSVR